MTTETLEANLHKVLATLKTARDELRVDLHLAKMDARDEWKKLQSRMRTLEFLIKDVDATASEYTERLRQLGRELKEQLSSEI